MGRNELTAALFKAIAHPARVAIIEALRSGPRCVCELVPLLEVEQPAASKHLNVLKNQGFIVGSKEGQRVIYRLADDAVLRLLDLGYGFLENRWRREGVLWAGETAQGGPPADRS